jgi:predicted 2-oxoglutarate/Fe(II)-dependent dioxygenase YbiX/peroxiredoxin
MVYKILNSGDTPPMFTQRSMTAENYAFDTVGGRFIVLGFFGTVKDPVGLAMWEKVKAHRRLFDDENLPFFGVTVDKSDVSERRLMQFLPGVRHFIDEDTHVSRLYGAMPVEGEGEYRPHWMLLDPMMRVHTIIPIEKDGSDFEKLKTLIATLPTINNQVGFEIMAPVLVLPRVFEPELCTHLMGLYEKHGGEISGFMRQENGMTVGAHDLSHKSRTDFNIEDDKLKKLLQRRIQAKIVPQIEKAYQYHVTRMERYLVACYDAKTGGHFKAHRDNTTSGTAHRRFAVSINLNDAFEGGEVGFAEYGTRTFKPPPGGAVIFSCSLLHHVTKVTSGKRYAFLPFLYDDAAAEIRKANNVLLADNVHQYKDAA